MTEGHPTSCALRPTTGHEIEWPMLPLEGKASLLVVGGGPAGIEAARAGIERGFEVTLWEAGEKLGGHLWPAAEPDFKQDIANYLNYLLHLEKQLSIKVVLNKRGSTQDIINFGADYVVLATGAVMEAIPFASTDSVKVLKATELLTSQATTQGSKIVVMGGGLVGCETALFLARRGEQVTLTTRRGEDKLGGDIVDRSNRKMLQQMIRDSSIEVIDNAVPVRSEQGNIIAEKDSEEFSIAADSLVFAGRLIPQNSLKKELENAGDQYKGRIFSAGDCIKVGSIMTAVWDSFNAIRKIAA